MATALGDMDLEGFRDYLYLLARLQVRPGLQDKIDLSGVVQVTLLEAYQARGQLRGQTDAQKAAWLRRILVNNLADAFRKLRSAKRHIRLECSLEAALEQSSARLESLLASSQSSPSQQVAHQEDLQRLSHALALLSESQRQAVELHHLQGWTLQQTADELACSKAAVAGLLHRGLQKLRRLLEERSGD